MSTFEWVIVITLIAGVGGTGLGGVIGAFVNKNSEKSVSFLLSFAAGVMVSVVCFDLILDAIMQNKDSTMHIIRVVMMILIGYVIIIFLLNYWIDKTSNPEVAHISETHPKTADQLSELIHSDHYEEHKKNNKKSLFIGGIVMACAIALHNLPEGMVIGASYAQEQTIGFTLSGGLTMAIVIGLHNIPEGMSVSVPLIAGGMNKFKAIIITTLTGAPTIIGAMLGYGLGIVSQTAMAMSLSFASGAMLYVVFGELLPEAILMWRSKMPAFGMLIGILTGIFIIFV